MARANASQFYSKSLFSNYHFISRVCLLFTVQAPEAGQVAFTEFKTASQSLASNDDVIELTTEKSSAEDAPSLDERTADVKLKSDNVVTTTTAAEASSAEVTTTLPSTLNLSDTEAIPAEIERSSNSLASQLSTAQHQQQQQQQKRQQLSDKSDSDEGCDSNLNPNCMPATTVAGDLQADQETTLQPLAFPDISSSALDIVTSSILDQPEEGFCSESDADCSMKPTAALLTADNLKTVEATSSDHFLLFEASRDAEDGEFSTVRPENNTAGSRDANNEGSGGETANTIATGGILKKSDRRADGGSGLPDVNEIISGLLNVVGEGLTIATNYVKEEHKRKKEALASQVLELHSGPLNKTNPHHF